MGGKDQMAKLIITGDLKEQDVWTIAKFFREFWRHREEQIFMNIEGIEDMKQAEVQAIFKKVFTSDDKDWTSEEINQEMIDKFKKEIE